MATYRAVAAVSDAVIHLLESHFQLDEFDGNQLQFQVYLASDFAKAMDAGVSFFLYRIYANGVHRTPRSRTDSNGQRLRTALPLDLHFLLTAWAQDASLQHTIAGWMMRTMEDAPLLPAGLLNSVIPDVFNPDESVEVMLADLSTEDLLHVWETLVQNTYQLSVPYVARNIRLESRLLQPAGEPVQRRTFEYTDATDTSPRT